MAELADPFGRKSKLDGETFEGSASQAVAIDRGVASLVPTTMAQFEADYG
jgi:hypothetical protein